MRAWPAAKDPGDWDAVKAHFVGADEGDYLAQVGGLDAVQSLPLPIF